MNKGSERTQSLHVARTHIGFTLTNMETNEFNGKNNVIFKTLKAENRSSSIYNDR